MRIIVIYMFISIGINCGCSQNDNLKNEIETFCSTTLLLSFSNSRGLEFPVFELIESGHYEFIKNPLAPHVETDVPDFTSKAEELLPLVARYQVLVNDGFRFSTKKELEAIANKMTDFTRRSAPSFVKMCNDHFQPYIDQCSSKDRSGEAYKKCADSYYSSFETGLRNHEYYSIITKGFIDYKQITYSALENAIKQENKNDAIGEAISTNCINPVIQLVANGIYYPNRIAYQITYSSKETFDELKKTLDDYLNSKYYRRADRLENTALADGFRSTLRKRLMWDYFSTYMKKCSAQIIVEDEGSAIALKKTYPVDLSKFEINGVVDLNKLNEIN